MKIFTGRECTQLVAYSVQEQCDYIRLEAGPVVQILCSKDKGVAEITDLFNKALAQIAIEKKEGDKQLYLVFIEASKERVPLAQCVLTVLPSHVQQREPTFYDALKGTEGLPPLYPHKKI